MILDRLSNANRYRQLCPTITAALEFLAIAPLDRLDIGKHPIDGERVFANVMEYHTKPASQCPWEAHRKYIDVQHIVSGQERMGWAPLASMRIAQGYDPAKDVVFFDGTGQTFTVGAGMFTIFFPEDAHQPSMAVDAPAMVRKIVVKAAV